MEAARQLTETGLSKLGGICIIQKLYISKWKVKIWKNMRECTCSKCSIQHTDVVEPSIPDINMLELEWNEL